MMLGIDAEVLGQSKVLKVMAKKEDKVYEKGIKVSDEEMKKLEIKKHKFHGEWNLLLNQYCKSYFVPIP